MKKCISLGEWNKNYLYIIAEVISINVYCLCVGNGFYTYQIGIFHDIGYFGHFYIHKLFFYLLILICSSLFLLYETKRDKLILICSSLFLLYETKRDKNNKSHEESENIELAISIIHIIMFFLAITIYLILPIKKYFEWKLVCKITFIIFISLLIV